MFLLLLCAVAARSQEINLSVKNASLESVFTQLEKQSGYTFFYKVELIRTLPAVTADIRHATIRQARRAKEPDPVAAAILATLAGADGITVHLREDRRHIQDRDVRLMKKKPPARTSLNLEMAATAEMLDIALRHRPHAACIVPEKREEVTTEGGLDAAARKRYAVSP